MKFLTVEQSRAVDQAATASCKIPLYALMRRAGTALANTVIRFARLRQTRLVLLVAGHGNNGGDACVAARCLQEEGFIVQVLLTCVPAQLRGDAHQAWDDMRTAGVPYTVLPTAESWLDREGVATDWYDRPCIVVDGILGTGCSAAPRDTAKAAIDWVNSMRSSAFVIAADLPSGMNGNSGETPGTVVQADATVTFARPKSCFLSDKSAAFCGSLIVADIGIPSDIADAATAPAPCELIAEPEIRSHIKPRRRDANKRDFGHVAILGGSATYPHAPVLAALGALRNGAGLVTLVVPPESTLAAGAWVPEAILNTRCSENGLLTVTGLRAGRFDPMVYSVLLIGPGLSIDDKITDLVREFLAMPKGRIVLDADGLNALSALDRAGQVPPRAPGLELILTPHPGEAGRLLQISAAEVQSDRLAAVRKLAARYHACVVLKGAGTLIAEPNGIPWLNRTGNPGMATGGTGDVLAGMIASRWAQGESALNAACRSVWAHGVAGDAAAAELGEDALSATTLIRHL